MYRYHEHLRRLCKVHRPIASISIPTAITTVWKTFRVITGGLTRRQSAQIHHALSKHQNPILLIRSIKLTFQPLSILGRSLATKSPGLSSETDQNDGKNRSEKIHSSHQQSSEMANNQDEIIAQNINNGKSMENQQSVSSSRGGAKPTSSVPKYSSTRALLEQTNPVPFEIRFIPLLKTRHFPLTKSRHFSSFRTRHFYDGPKGQQEFPRSNAKNKNPSQRSKHFSRNLQTRVRNHYYMPLSDIGITSFSVSKSSLNHQARIPTRLRKGSVIWLRRLTDLSIYMISPTSSRKLKYVSLNPFKPYKIKNIGNYLDDIDFKWLLNYALIIKFGNSIPPPVTGMHVWPRLITSDMNIQQVREIWQSMCPRFVKRHWQNHMLWALQQSPETALKSLDVAISYSVPEIPRYIIEDCLDYLAVVFLGEFSSPNPYKFEAIYRITCNFIKATRGERGHYSIKQRTVYLILAHCSNEQAEALYQNMCDHRISIYSFTLLHFLRRFSNAGKWSLCVDVIQKVTESRIDLKSDIIQKELGSLLRCPSLKTLYKNNTSPLILTELSRMGIGLNIFGYNTAMTESVASGDYDTALNIYKVLRENGPRADAVTFRILLQGCRETQDREGLYSLISHIESTALVPEDDELIFNMLYASLRIESRMDQCLAFTNLLPLYATYYDARPLQEIGLVEMGLSTRSRKLPFAKVLWVMVVAFIRQHSQSSTMLMNLYRRYWDLVMQKHPLIAPIATTDHVANSFIYAFGQSLDTLDMCTTIVRSMLELESSNTYQIAGPTVHTWSVLLKVLTQHFQMIAAEKVLSMMKERDISPNRITWNTLVFGYARAQDVDNAMHSVERMEVEGYPIDDYTLLALSKLKDRDMLMEALKSAVMEDRQADSCVLKHLRD